MASIAEIRAEFNKANELLPEVKKSDFTNFSDNEFRELNDQRAAAIRCIEDFSNNVINEHYLRYGNISDFKAMQIGIRVCNFVREMRDATTDAERQQAAAKDFQEKVNPSSEINPESRAGLGGLTGGIIGAVAGFFSVYAYAAAASAPGAAGPITGAIIKLVLLGIAVGVAIPAAVFGILIGCCIGCCATNNPRAPIMTQSVTQNTFGFFSHLNNANTRQAGLAGTQTPYAPSAPPADPDPQEVVRLAG